MIVIDGVGRYCSGDDCESSSALGGASLGRAVRPLMRIFRVARAMSFVCFSSRGVHSKIDRMFDEMTDRLLRSVLGDFLLVPGENITMKFSEGQFHLEKAQVRSRVLRDIHLPFTILGGLIDFIHLDIDVVQSK